MTSLEEFSKGFLAGWLKTLLESMERNLDEDTKLKIFQETGSYCAQAHVAEKFKEIKLKTNNISELVSILNEQFKGTQWELLENGKLRVVYQRCFCPIVHFKLHESEVQCICSVGWLKNNLEILFNKDVKVELLGSVLRGGKMCEFLVEF